MSLADEMLSSPMSRRSILRKGAIAGLTIPVASSILAACEDDAVVDDDPPAFDPRDPVDLVDNDDDDDDPGPDDDMVGDDDDDDDEPVNDDDDDEDEVVVNDAYESLFGDQYEPAQNEGGQIVEGAFTDAETMNAILTQDTSSSRVIFMMTQPLIINHPETTEPEPMVAESWDISDDGLEYTFRLRDDVTWHDGEGLDAEDVVFTYETHMHEDTGSPRYAELSNRIETVEALDDYTVQFKLNHSASPFLQQNMVYGLVPEHVLADVDPADLADHPFSTGEPGATIGCGPFQFHEWVSGASVTLVKYPDYFLGEPHIDQWIRRIIPDPTVLAQQIGAGEVDYGQVRESDYEGMEANDSIDVTLVDAFGFTYYSYQLNEERTTLFQEREVRQALLYGLDREALVQSIRFGIGEVAVGTMPVPSWAYDPGAIERHYEYDPDRARDMLEEAGWVVGDDGIRERDGERFSFEIYTNAGNQVHEQYIVVMQEQWREIGVECIPRAEEWNSFLDRITNSRDFEMFLVGFSWGVDPHQETMWHTDAAQGGFNMNQYSNPEVDELIERGLETTDRDERIALYNDMQNIILDDLPSPILDFPQHVHCVNVRLHNIFPNHVWFTANAHEWWVDE